LSRRANPALVGSFVLGGVLLAVIGVVSFGSGRLFRDTESYISFFEGSVAGLTVEQILLDLPDVVRQEDDLRIAVIYNLDREWVEQRGASSRIEDPLEIGRLMSLGIRAELGTESLVTGIKYVALDLDPANPVAFDPVINAPYPEIPTVNTGFDRIEDAVYGIISDLGAVPLDSLVTVATDAFQRFGDLASSPALATTMDELPATLEQLNATVGDLQLFVAHLDSTVAPMREDVSRAAQQATAAFARVDSTLATVGAALDDFRGTIEPTSPVFVQFERAMLELSGASRALRNLADYLERNPAALVRGRPGVDP